MAGSIELPKVKTVVETTSNGTYNVWFKYENVSTDFVTKMRSNMETHIYEEHVRGMSKKQIELPQDDVDKVISTLVATVQMLDKASALAFLKANKDRTDTIGYIPLFWASIRYTGLPEEVAVQKLKDNPGKEKMMYESIVNQFQIPIA